MGIKSTLIDYSKLSITYPCLKIYRPGAENKSAFWRIVLFNGHNKGQCVACSQKNLVGEMSNSWAERDFKFFQSRIIMENDYDGGETKCDT